MKEYKLTAKKTYHASNDYPINLLEYMIFENGELNDKVLLLKLHNDELESIKNIVIKIQQLDQSRKELFSANYLFNDKHIVSKENAFVPNKKIKLHVACETIKYELIKVELEDSIWQEDQWNKKQNTSIEKREGLKIHSFPTQNHIDLKLPYFISLVTLIIHVLVLVSVFYIINL